METLQYEDVERLLKSGEISFFNIYNADTSLQTYYTTKYYDTNKSDTIEKVQYPTIVFLDIECFLDNQGSDKDMISGEFPINAITIHSNKTNIYKAYYLLLDRNYENFGIKNEDTFNYDEFIKNKINNYKNALIVGGYIQDKNEIEIEIYIYKDEKELLFDCWKEIHNIDPAILSGFNSDRFDYPYMYNRAVKLFGLPDANWILSKFGTIEVRGNFVNIPEFTIMDILHLYKPRDEGGLNLGKKLPQYSLNHIAYKELKLEKIEYKSTSISLDDLYLNDPSEFLLYNIADTLLTAKLNQKLKHIELYNMIRRNMYTPVSSAMIGSSPLFESIIYYNLIQNSKLVRFGINGESTRSIEVERLSNYPVPIDPKKGKVNPVKIPSKTYSTWTSKFTGAYVKQPFATIINDGSLIIDLDAASLYPSMILQSNISFDSYRGRILPPTVYKSLTLIEHALNSKGFPSNLASNIFDLIEKYIKRENPTQKAQTRATLYYLILFLFDQIYKSEITFDKLLHPTETNEIIILKTYLIPLLDILNWIHPENNSYNNFVYDYFFMDDSQFEKKYDEIFIVHDPYESTTKIQRYKLQDALNVIQKYSLTLSGTLFSKHEEHTGLLTEFLTTMGALRKKYKTERDKNPEGSDLYILNDTRQASVKVIMNTSYGLYGLSGFRFSNHHLAQSITNQGMLSIKLASHLAEEHLKYKFQDGMENND